MMYNPLPNSGNRSFMHLSSNSRQYKAINSYAHSPRRTSMLNRLTLFVVFGTITLGLSACGESPAPAKEADAPKAEAPKAAPVEVAYYDLTKESITTHADWTSRNVMVMGVKLGDKTNDVAEKNLGAQLGKTNVLADEYQTYYQKNGIALFTFKLTNKIKRIEVLQGFAEKIADPKLKNLLATGDLKQMRDIFGMEESMEEKPDIMGTEYVYDTRGIRFIKYKGGNTGLRFSELKK
jgi:hypothetical protein